jgi:hypothetical protein
MQRAFPGRDRISRDRACYCGANPLLRGDTYALLRSYVFVVPKLGEAQDAFAFSSTPHSLVPDMVGLVLRRRIFGHPIGLVVELRRIVPFGDSAIAG